MSTLLPDGTRLFDGLSLPVMILDRDLRFVYANAAYLDATHSTFDALDGQYVFDVFPETPERVEAVRSRFERVLQGEITKLDAQPFRVEFEDGSWRDLVWEATQDPLYDEDGNVIGLIQRAADITRQHELEQRNKAIGYELSHRIKNIMAVVGSIARITGRSANDVGTFVQAFTARINSMSRTNDLLAEGEWRGLDVETIFRDELDPYDKSEDEDGAVYSLYGPHIRLAIDASKDLSMVSHELATNAAKYGCLSHKGGRLTINWTRTDDCLVIDWREACKKELKAPESTGFGTRLFDMLPYVTVERDFTPTGLHLTIRMDGEKVFA